MDDIHSLSEEDIKLRYITPAILAKGWSVQDITMETKVKLTDGKINLRGNLVARNKAKFADYMLYYNRATPIAIVEAKDANHSVSFGMQQAKEYAVMMDIPFAFSSNGFGFQEYDFLTGKERSIPMDAFPTKEELYDRFLHESNGGEGITDNGDKRMLLVMATGTGKTYTAFQIVYRLLKTELVKKVLYLADRNILVDQSIEQDFKPLTNTIHKVNYQQDKENPDTAHEVYFALYQQLIGKEGAKNYEELFKPEFFDMVIVDECHRGSAKDDSNWREILEYFEDAIQLGMTATPKETRYQSNISYFGEPLYTYSLKEGIDDGFLAPFKVINITTNIGDEWRPTKGQRDINGNVIEDRIYNNTDYDYNIIIEDRIREVAHEVSSYLKSTDPMAKTIVFCADEDHAERMRVALVNENAEMCKKNPDYVVRITGSDPYGQSKLDYFISVASKTPVIATTSKLLSTGVDCKMVKLIALDQRINSMTEFKQIVGRGTRIREKEGKTHFTIMDFRNITRLFADPDWDGPLEVDKGYMPDRAKPYTPPKDQPDDGGGVHDVKPIVNRDGCEVKIIINDFILHWNAAERKVEITELMRENGIDLQALKHDQGMYDVDDFDFICYIAYGKKPLTRKERAENVKKRDVFHKYGPEAQKVLEALLDKYMNEGISQLENRKVLTLDPFRHMGSPSGIAKLFGGNQQYMAAVKELEDSIYNDIA